MEIQADVNPNPPMWNQKKNETTYVQADLLFGDWDYLPHRKDDERKACRDRPIIKRAGARPARSSQEECHLSTAPWSELGERDHPPGATRRRKIRESRSKGIP